MDAVDPKKLRAVRLGGELRGLLGKAQDEFLAYEDSFEEFAHEIGVSIALQNLAASLSQVFPIIARLRTAKFMLNKKFKADVLFAFQEFNSYYTSLFMELSMSVARRSGIVLPLPSPVRPAPVEEPAPAPPELPAPAPVEELPPLPVPEEPGNAEVKAERLCLQAHGHYFGYRQAENPEQAFQLYQKDKATYHKAPQKQRELHALALVRFTQAAENGHKDAQFHKDVVQACAWYKRAAEQNHIGAATALGRLLCVGSADAVEKDVVQAIHYLQRAAAEADVLALRQLGLVYAAGDDVKKDVDRATLCLRKAAAGGDHEAMYHLGVLLLSNDPDATAMQLEDSEDRFDEAVRWLLNAAAAGIVDANYVLGQTFENSKYLRDKSAALRYYTKAARARPVHAKAARRAAVMHYSGIACQVDRWKAHSLYTLAADAGDADSLNALGLMYEEGEGCDLDYRQAAACYRKAIELHNPHAHFNLGCLLSQGKGVARNSDAAQSHFQKAVELGFALAKDFLVENR
ncbi:TPA: hypothetical protein N0F65_010063 [Lagenidium giganteum]|uniref:HCP-like protein n=1 Tax=Lagenidium giganteum TaxID=4803 RepID=A0AAV2ZHN7_9STRA|nr:TPA: hypothetical protein N0F65_010063 [Lagenidium giganteum]